MSQKRTFKGHNYIYLFILCSQLTAVDLLENMTNFLHHLSYLKDANYTDESSESKPEHIKEAAKYVYLYHSIKCTFWLVSIHVKVMIQMPCCS